ncbi:hypothetical protein PF005_g27919 [Phytophthora fragariae]|uniref:Uncharacterized protein n=1 Tax=Phytophthora fragariae TaxID=53985 RepID=A0A6A3DRR9_9STRA|nr:hypothetical protein PF009_g28595 [Phytophthora fragariae]KAE8962215.1 hypothetical protein PF011_g29469 [Phytophthora fragariae]KAE9080612.1 hypothetical protein PF006_g27282 [Phytophthora fragariae]KAE9086907.1 hypothetical protein PF007_g20586 [Phytophthora fragariae]KAE9169560.1 hypothetical protein PF005_g27919 [Phytophthora fragariae]
MLKFEMTHKKEQKSQADLQQDHEDVRRQCITRARVVHLERRRQLRHQAAVRLRLVRGRDQGHVGQGIKSLLLDDDDQAKTSFFKEVEVWRRLNNPHVVELFGACHVSTPHRRQDRVFCGPLHGGHERLQD